jgi:hypothetical protein
MFIAGFCVAKLSPTNVYAQANAPTHSFSVPKAYGTLKATMGEMLLFEDANGTVRFVVLDPEMARVVTRIGGPAVVVSTINRQ